MRRRECHQDERHLAPWAEAEDTNLGVAAATQRPAQWLPCSLLPLAKRLRPAQWRAADAAVDGAMAAPRRQAPAPHAAAQQAPTPQVPASRFA
mmetsp:Transcript_7251/g.18238  ORF Transcript_7251/g.18238 Transcript_7251/m.18238 type:complete len:93 (-) Transcript_7251:126-404(-)